MSAPAVLVIDAFENIASSRGREDQGEGEGASHSFDRLLSCLLTELDGIASDAPVEEPDSRGSSADSDSQFY